jgi:hypothetical protein
MERNQGYYQVKNQVGEQMHNDIICFTKKERLVDFVLTEKISRILYYFSHVRSWGLMVREGKHFFFIFIIM